MPEELDDERALLDEEIQDYRQRAPVGGWGSSPGIWARASLRS